MVGHIVNIVVLVFQKRFFQRQGRGPCAPHLGIPLVDVSELIHQRQAVGQLIRQHRVGIWNDGEGGGCIAVTGKKLLHIRQILFNALLVQAVELVEHIVILAIDHRIVFLLADQIFGSGFEANPVVTQHKLVVDIGLVGAGVLAVHQRFDCKGRLELQVAIFHLGKLPPADEHIEHRKDGDKRREKEHQRIFCNLFHVAVSFHQNRK